MLIYLDNCCFNRPFDEQNQVRVLLETEAKLVVQERIREGSLDLAWSFMMDFENDLLRMWDNRTKEYPKGRKRFLDKEWAN